MRFHFLSLAYFIAVVLNTFFHPCIVFTHGVRMGGWASGRVSGEKFVQTVSQKSVSCRKLILGRTLVRTCRCATPWSDLDLTFDLAVVTLSLKVLSGLYLRNRKV